MTEEGFWELIGTRSDATAGVRAGARLTVPETQAVDLVTSGVAWPAGGIDRPPYILLSRVKEAMGRIELLGPPIEGEKKIDEIVAKVFPAAVRQTFVGGNTLVWAAGKVGLREMVGRQLSNSKDAEVEPFGLLRFVGLGGIGNSTYYSEEIRQKLYGDEYAREEPEDHDDFDRLLFNPGRSMEWREFLFQVLTLQGRFESLIVRALREGRILAAQTARAGDRFVAPVAAAAIPVGDISDSFQFALSSGLPRSLFERLAPLNTRRDAATRFIEDLNQQYAGSGRQFTSEDVKTIIQERYDLTPNAAKDAWAAAKISKAKFRNIRKDIKIPIDELRAVAIIERGK